MANLIEYSLFRLAFVRPAQGVLTADSLTARQLIIEALRARPVLNGVKGIKWRIGNFDLFTDDTGYFALGKITTKSIELFDESSGDFVERELEQSPYTPCVFNAAIGIVCIARKTMLAHSTVTLANRLEALLSNTDAAIRNQIVVEVRPIRDPNGFIAQLVEAFRVVKFTATFKGPNPFDADEFFQKPLSVYLNAADGKEGTATIRGGDLNRDTLREVTRSTVATGNDASAQIQPIEHGAKRVIHLRGDAIKRSFPEGESDPRQVLDVMTLAYEGVRNEDDQN